jgi:hypothetical protein
MNMTILGIGRLFRNIRTDWMKEGTLQLGTSTWKTVKVTVLIFIVFIIFGEAIARHKPFRVLFIAPGVASTHRQFERQLGRVRVIYEEEGKIDCIVIGSSTVWEGFNPILFQQAFKAKTGENFSCFNFGIDGLTAAGAGVVAQVLVEKYHPQLLIYGTDPRDYIYPLDTWENTTIMDSPWVQYQLGKGNTLGWLYEHSALLQYQEPLRQVLHLRFYRELRRYLDYEEEAQWGYLPIPEPRVSVSKPPSHYPDSEYVTGYYKLLSNYQMYPVNIQGLKQVISQQRNGTQVLVLEMPVAPGYMNFFTNGDMDYEEYINRLNKYLETGRVPFLRTQASISIPIEGWTDYNHLNREGSKPFTEWLAIKVGEMFMDGTISPLVP